MTPNNTPIDLVLSDDNIAEQGTLVDQSNDMYFKFFSTSQVYSDQTGLFLILSSRGFKYIMVFYDYDSNYICARPIKTKTSKELNVTTKIIISTLTKIGFKPKFWILDNKSSQVVKTTFQEAKIIYQLVPSGIHKKI